MKKIISLIIFAICCITFISCSKEIEGKWDDNIKLSQKHVELNSNENSVTITTESTSWWLIGIALDSNPVDFQQVDYSSQNFILEKPEFTIERINGNMIKIKMNANSTNNERTLIVNLQNGDYFDGITLIQKAN